MAESTKENMYQDPDQDCVVNIFTIVAVLSSRIKCCSLWMAPPLSLSPKGGAVAHTFGTNNRPPFPDTRGAIQ